jgi:hypothetical protein
MDDLTPIADDDFLDSLAWSLQHQIRPIRSLLRQSTSLEACRYVARLQLEHLRRSGILTYRRQRSNFGQFRSAGDEK